MNCVCGGKKRRKNQLFLKLVLKYDDLSTYLGIYTLKKNFSVESTHIFIFKNYTNCKRKNKRLFFFSSP